MDIKDPKILYEKFQPPAGLEFVRYLFKIRAQEVDILDFKLKAGLPRKKNEPYAPVEHMLPNDREIIAKGISAFSNSAGGVLVWGVDCSSSGGTDIDAVTNLIPLKNPKQFYGDIQTALHELTKPAIKVDCHIVFVDPDQMDQKLQEGYIVMFVPPIDSARFPVISKVDNQCYVRVGGSSIKPAPDDLVRMERQRASGQLKDYSLAYRGPLRHMLEYHRHDADLAAYAKVVTEGEWPQKIKSMDCAIRYIENSFGRSNPALIPAWTWMKVLYGNNCQSKEGDVYIDKAVALCRELNLTHDPDMEFGNILSLQAESLAARGLAQEAIAALSEAVAVMEKFPEKYKPETIDDWVYDPLASAKADLTDPKKWVAESQQRRAEDGRTSFSFPIPTDFMITRNKEQNESD